MIRWIQVILFLGSIFAIGWSVGHEQGIAQEGREWAANWKHRLDDENTSISLALRERDQAMAKLAACGNPKEKPLVLKNSTFDNGDAKVNDYVVMYNPYAPITVTAGKPPITFYGIHFENGGTTTEDRKWNDIVNGKRKMTLADTAPLVSKPAAPGTPPLVIPKGTPIDNLDAWEPLLDAPQYGHLEIESGFSDMVNGECWVPKGKLRIDLSSYRSTLVATCVSNPSHLSWLISDDKFWIFDSDKKCAYVSWVLATAPRGKQPKKGKQLYPSIRYTIKDYVWKQDKSVKLPLWTLHHGKRQVAKVYKPEFSDDYFAMMGDESDPWMLIVYPRGARLYEAAHSGYELPPPPHELGPPISFGDGTRINQPEVARTGKYICSVEKHDLVCRPKVIKQSTHGSPAVAGVTGNVTITVKEAK